MKKWRVGKWPTSDEVRHEETITADRVARSFDVDTRKAALTFMAGTEAVAYFESYDYCILEERE